ncbi:ATP-binding protein [Microbulbifer aggregans]|uniref:ATP-binding protein n=1 Tax=Microbulbifer aggregans TaxID=1769779 RepID=UPI001CFD4A37|nr:ATP-binding protein [Microbulbifer aggregans]
MKSIRIFLLIALLSTITLVNFVSALHGYRASMDEAQALFDRQIAATARMLASLSGNGAPQQVVQQNDLLAFQVWRDDGVLVLRSNNAPLTPVVPAKEGYSEVNFSGYRWRVFGLRDAENARWIYVAERVDLRYNLADEVIVESVLPILLGLPVAGLLIWLVIGRGLSSLRRLARALSNKRAEDFRPLPEDNAPAELLPVIHSTNSLLQRLQASFERERRFSADAAHELRTPISAIQIHAHNLAQEITEAGVSPLPESLPRLRQSIERMAHLVEQMLDLFRTTPEHYPARFELVDLHQLARTTIAERYEQFEQRRQSVELRGHRATMSGDQFALTILLQNLLANAGKYTPEGGRVLVTVEPTESGICLRVEDSGPGIAADERERVFERFYRIRGDRHASLAAGCGLGLSIVQHIAQLHHASIVLGESSLGQGLSVQVSFPSANEHERGAGSEEQTGQARKENPIG